MELIETMGPVLIQHSELPAKSWSGKWAVIESCWCHLKAPQFNGMERSGADASVVAVPSEEPDYHRVESSRQKGRRMAIRTLDIATFDHCLLSAVST